ncbi:putative ribonuclease H-like domain-containing protein [Tanacetum coccineum]
MSADSSSDSRSFILVSSGWLAKLLRNRSILSKQESTKAKKFCSSWSSWTARARSAAGRTGRLLVGGGFAFSIMKNGIVNENYEQPHKEKIDYEKANVRKLNFSLERIQVSRTKGIKFLNKTLHAYFKEEGIEHQTSTPQTPKQNGIVERQNCTLVKAARTMLSAFNLPLFFWAEAIATACYTQNRSGNPEILLQDHAVVDSGCSSHMTGNKAYLSDYEDYNGGFVAFGSDPKRGKITGKGKIRTANLDFDDIYFVDELKFNLFSVSQMCDKKNSVLFTETECLILSSSFKLLDESQVVLRVPRKDDVYILDLKNIVSSGGITCLYANATADESKLWHRRLGHVNFKNINKLDKGHLARGLPSKVFVNDHTCVACKKGKQHKASCKTKLERIIRKPLELLHMDLFGLVFVESINKKRYSLVVTDDFNRFSWIFFLATKDETSEILCKFIIGLENQLNHNVKIIRCDNGTEFKNHAMNEFCVHQGTIKDLLRILTASTNNSYGDKDLVDEFALLPHEKPSKSSPKDNNVQDLKDVADKEG